MCSETLKELFAKEIVNLRKCNSPVVLVFVHRQADPDALCTAAGLVDIITKTFPESSFQFSIVVPQSVSTLGQIVSSQLSIEYTLQVDDSLIHRADLIVIVDTGSPNLLEPYHQQVKKSLARKVLIDHHSASDPPTSWSWIDANFVRSESTSTCEIITLGFQDCPISKGTAQTLLTGLMFDSQHLGIATKQTLEAALILVTAGAEIELAKRILRNKPDRSEILARIKSAQRLQYFESGRYMFLKSEVSSFQASVARMLLDVGGDVGVAYGQNNDEARISVRSTQSFFKETGINLSLITKYVCDEMGLIGGGHPTASSLSGIGSSAEIATKLLDTIVATLPRK
ncbi:MAG: DHH family phosphoesterase [Nitrososphaerota archaeon]|nr:DHH family phosphoesterase [Nitrososphaerota archaeon]